MKHYQLYTFTQMEIASARRMAKLGQKDAARDRLRFIQNSRIIEILKEYEFPKALNVDAALLGWQMTELANECHPSSGGPPDGNLDVIMGIKAQLDVIAHFICELKQDVPKSNP